MKPLDSPGPNERLLVCQRCGLVQRSRSAGVQRSLRCSRCLGALRLGRPHSVQRTAAFSLAALILYAPANLLPIMEMERFGLRTENTIWSGCVALYRSGMWSVALIVFFASILVPLVKLIGLFF